eukprot:TRINITY_DN42394_c0_g1_i1.p1 TRINITY_DN42394_c0_g1~~TRINITY_DN42394_c0_g1_i1.p1  ORF type:complete len:1375 (-),score=190.03 TRINITY_DN42394_c0_g1_i1:50-3868(-)
MQVSAKFTQQGFLPDIQRLWRSCDSRLILWKYADPRVPEVTEYHGVMQQIVAVATARPKDFVAGIDHFLVISTPAEISLHALRFAPGSDHLLPPVRTHHAVATDDIVCGAIATDPSSGRIFFGGNDGCIHEFQYFDDETQWLGRPRKCRKNTFSRMHAIQSRLPTFLQRVSEAVFGPSEMIAQLVVDSSRGLLFALSSLSTDSTAIWHSSMSTITVYHLPPCRRDSAGRLEEPPLVQLCTITQNSVAHEVARIKGRLFPGLLPSSHRGLNPFAAVSAATGMTAMPPRFVRLVPVSKGQGGSVVACIIAEDGTRVYLRGVYRTPLFSQSTGSGVSASDASGTYGGSYNTHDMMRRTATMSSLAVHHVRFLDASAPRNLRVRDAIVENGITLLLCRIPAQSSVQAEQTDNPSKPEEVSSGEDAVLAFSLDMRAVAQRQSRGRSPWLYSSAVMVEHIDVIRLGRPDQGESATDTSGQIVGIAPLANPIPRPLQSLYSKTPGNELVLPVLGLSELAKEQLLPPPRFMLLSTLGVHMLKKIQPLDILRECVLTGDLASLQDFILKYTAEQTSAILFQLLTQAVPRALEAQGLGPGLAMPAYRSGAVGGDRASTHRAWIESATDGLHQAAGYGPLETGSLRSGTLSTALPQLARDGDFGHARQSGHGDFMRRLAQMPRLGSSAVAAFPSQEPMDETALLRVEQLLLSPHVARQMGLAQAWPAVDSQRSQSQPSWTPGSSLGHCMQAGSTHCLSGRLRGLYLYLSRLLRPFWLAPIMLVTWPASAPGSEASRLKRRRDEWWPPPPEPPPSAKGAQWRCALSKMQRIHLQTQLTLLGAALERCLSRLGIDETVRVHAPGSTAANGAPVQEEAIATDGAVRLISTALEVLDFLELLSSRGDSMSAAPCQPETLLRFSEMTFRDLVCQPEARRVLHQLLQAGIVGCRQLHSRCPSLFSTADLQVQEAYELLKRVQTSLGSASVGGSALDLARLSHLTQQALQILQKHSSQVDLMEVTSRLRSVGAFKGLIALCLSVARCRDPRDEAIRPQDSANPRIQQLHYARLECYQMIIDVLEDFVAFARKRGMMLSSWLHSGGPHEVSAGSPGLVRTDLPELIPAQVTEADAIAILSALLRHCLEGREHQADELFHFCVLKWMMQCGLPPYKYNSPYLKKFLETHAQDQPEFLCRYLQHHGRWAEAYDAYLALAKKVHKRHAGTDASTNDESMALGIQEQLLLLQNAAICARMQGSNRRVEPILRMMTELSALEKQTKTAARKPATFR